MEMLAETSQEGEKHKDTQGYPIVNKDVGVVGAQRAGTGGHTFFKEVEEFFRNRAGNDRRGEKEGEASGGRALHAAEKSGRDGDAGTRNAGNQGKGLCEADSKTVGESDVVDVGSLLADFFGEDQEKR